MNHLGTPYCAAALSLVTGDEAIRRVLPELETAAEKWAQNAEVLELPHHFGVPMFPRRRPLLLLFRALETTELCAAVAVFAYGVSWFGNRLLSNADRLGRRGVYGPAVDRVEIAAVAAREFLRMGSTLVKLDFLGEDLPMNASEGMRGIDSQREQVRLVFSSEKQGVRWQIFPRPRFVDLRLFPTLDETLSNVGKRTRRNLRYHRRQCEEDLGLTFHPHAELGLLEFLMINKRSHRPLSERVARWRYTSSQGEPAFLTGIRTRDGRWLSLAGGRRVGETAVLDWQMNDLSFPRYSVSLVLRGYLIECFGAKGMRWFTLEGGTSHAIANAFRKRTVFHLQAERRVFWLWLFSRAMRRLFPGRGLTLSLFGGFAAAKRFSKG